MANKLPMIVCSNGCTTSWNDVTVKTEGMFRIYTCAVCSNAMGRSVAPARRSTVKQSSSPAQAPAQPAVDLDALLEGY